MSREVLTPRVEASVSKLSAWLGMLVVVEGLEVGSRSQREGLNSSRSLSGFDKG